MNDFGKYLQMLRYPFKKLAKLEFLQPDDSVAFSLDGVYKNGFSKRYDSRAFVQSGSLNVNFQNGRRRTASITLANIDGAFDFNVNNLWFGSRVRLLMGMMMPDGTEFYMPQGVFYLNHPQTVIDPSNRTITYSLEDKWSFLDGSLFGRLAQSYKVEQGVNIFSAMSSVLSLDKYTMISAATNTIDRLDILNPIYTNYYDEKTVTEKIINKDGSVEERTHLANETAFDTLVPIGGSAADILLGLNDNLVGVIGYDRTGRFTVEPSEYDLSDATKPFLWKFTKENSTFLGMSENKRISEVYNDIVVEGSGSQTYVYGRAQNYDPSSDTNINIIGMKTLVVQNPMYSRTDQCISYAKWHLKRKTVLRNSVTIESSQMFHLYENAQILVQRPDKEGAPIEPHLIQSYSLPIGETGKMTINAISSREYDLIVQTSSM